MTRPKAPDQLAKRGPKPKIGPKKRTWLNRFYDEWKAAEGKNARSEFYRRLTQLWFQTFGYELPFNDDPAGIVEMESLVQEVSTAGLTEEEVQRMDSLAKETNTVRHTLSLSLCLIPNETPSIQKLQAWCRNTFQYAGANSSQANETVENMFDNLITAETTSSMSVPRKPGILQYYASKHWPKIHPTYVEYRERDMMEHTTEGSKKPKPMKAQNPAIKKCWNDESEEFRRELVELRDAEWLEKEKEIAARASTADDVPRTPAQYQAYVYILYFCKLILTLAL